MTDRDYGRRAKAMLLTIAATMLVSMAIPSLPASAQSLINSTFKSQGRDVRVMEARGTGSGERPGVLILHGASGIGDGTHIYPVARALAEQGISAFIVQYLDGVPGTGGSRTAPKLHQVRDRVIDDALSHIARLPHVDPDRLGVFGMSLGAFQALQRASSDPRIKVVVNMMGALPAQVRRDAVHRMPPTLILHGDKDRIVPLGRAKELQQVLAKAGADYEMRIYPGQAHNFTGAALRDSIQLSAGFIARHLKQPGERRSFDGQLAFATYDVPVAATVQPEPPGRFDRLQ